MNPNAQVPSLSGSELHLWRFPYRASLGRSPLLRLLAAYLGLPVDEISVDNGLHGRPRLAVHHGSPFDFNWSHSGDHAVVAIGRNISPGVDIEMARRRNNVLAIAERYFHPVEYQWLTNVTGQDRQAAFLQLWTAKEAALKAEGRGIAFGLHRLHISCAGRSLRLLEMEGEDPHQWQLRRFQPAPNMLGALAWRGGVRRLRRFTLAEAP